MVNWRGFIGAIGVVGTTFFCASNAVAGDAIGGLKYRSPGSVCSCESGMGEAEISRAMARLGIGSQPAGASSVPKKKEEQPEGVPGSDAQQQLRREIDERK